MGINGAAARLIQPGDLVIVIAYALVSDEEVADLNPQVVFVDEHNQIILQGSDPADVPSGRGLHRGDLIPN